MKIYKVGGFCRDTLLGLEPKDIDYVVVGSSPEEMISLGYSQVGADFPVFLHPETKDEYALARTERKSGKGYHGFDTDFSKEITLEQDCKRRDLTINAMAFDESGELIDPFNGKHDLDNKVLRHVSEAFSEDPVRVLRTARFAARYGFEICPETYNLMIQMVNDGELDHLNPERVWLELEKGVKETDFHLMIQILRDIGALDRIIPEFISTEKSLSHLCLLKNNNVYDEVDVFVSLGFDIPKNKYNVYKLPSDISKMITLTNRIFDHFNLANRGLLVPIGMHEMFKFGDLRRNPERFKKAIFIIQHIMHIKDKDFKLNLVNIQRLMECRDEFLSLDTGSIALACKNKKDIPIKIFEAEISVIEKILK